jgi:DNA-binding FadR family transcriptional regulator
MNSPAHISRMSSDRALSTHDQLVRVLGTEIVSGVYKPGENLPPEAELLSRFQVSRTVLREVLKTLQAKGMVQSKTRVGTRLLDPSNWNFFDAEVLSWKVALGMDEEFRDHLVEIRRAVEPRAAALAARRATKEDIANLRHCIAMMRAEGHTRRTFSEADLAFHLAVAGASRNLLMRSMAAVIEAALVASFSLSSPVDDPERQVTSVARHEKIVDFIEGRDPEAAASAMLLVIDEGYERTELAARTS